MKLDLQVQDNFLPEELFTKLKKYSVTLDYSSKNIVQKSKEYEQHVFLSNPIFEDDDLIKDLE